MDTSIAGYQFIHIDWSTRLRTKKTTVMKSDHGNFRASGWSTRDLLAEAMRVEANCPHVANPQPPGLIYACSSDVGADPGIVADLADAWAASVKAVKGRALSILSPVMSNGVISFPKEREEEWPKFRDSSVDYLKDKYGDRLKLILEHTDEAHPHIHFYCVPLHELDENGVAFSEDFGTVHQGYGESRATRKEFIAEVGKNATNAKGKKYTKGAGTKKAYVDSMKSFQDEFHEKVGKFFGLGRVGPRVKKLTHSEAIRQKNIRQAETELLVAEQNRKAADTELAKALEAARQSTIASEEIKNSIIEESKLEAAQLQHEAKIKSDQVAKEILDRAEVSAAEKKKTIDALIAGDEKVTLRVFKENVDLKKQLATAQEDISRTDKVVASLNEQLEIAKIWIRTMVSKFESLGNFEFSNIFAKKKTEEESKNKARPRRPGA